MLTIQQLKLPVSHTENELEKKIIKTLKIKNIKNFNTNDNTNTLYLLF